MTRKDLRRWTMLALAWALAQSVGRLIGRIAIRRPEGDTLRQVRWVLKKSMVQPQASSAVAAS